MNRYTWAIVMAAIPLITALSVWRQTGEVNAPEISLLVLALIGALAVAATRDLSTGWRRFSNPGRCRCDFSKNRPPALRLR